MTPEERLERRREQNRAYSRTRTAWRNQDRKERRQRVVRKYGGECVCCGEREPLFLCIDHVHGGGNQDRGGSPHQVMRRLDKQPRSGDYQVLCFNCNAAKERGGCPHRTLRENS